MNQMNHTSQIDMSQATLHMELSILRQRVQALERENAALQQQLLVVHAGNPEHASEAGSSPQEREDDEHPHTHTALHLSEDHYRLLAAHIPDLAVFLFDSEWRYLLAEGMALQVFGLAKEVVEGKTFDQIIEPWLQPALAPVYQSAMDGQIRMLELTVGDRSYHVQSVPLHGEGNDAHLGMVVARDITEQRQIERELDYQLCFTHLIMDISSRFMRQGAGGIDGEIRRSLQTIGEFVDADRVRVVLFSPSPDGEKLLTFETPYAWYRDGLDRPFLSDLVYTLPWLEAQWSGLEVISVSCVSELPPEAHGEKHALLSCKVRSFLAVPLICEERLIGRLVLTALRQEIRWSDDVVALIRVVAEIITAALQRKQAEEALQASEELFRTSVESMLDGFAVFTAIRDEEQRIVDFRYTYINEAGCQLNQRTREDQIGHTLLELFPAQGPTGLLDAYVQVVETGVPLQMEALVYEDHFGQGRQQYTFDLRVSKLGDGFMVIWRDVTSRHQMEEQLRASLQEKEVLLREVHHRVKNNLQVITSLLRLQTEQLSDPDLRVPFVESQNRIRAMALLHEHLYRSRDIAQIGFADYVRQLATVVVRSYMPSVNHVTLVVAVDPTLRLDLDLATPLGLIVVELVSNSARHAFLAGAAGTISVSMHRLEHTFLLRVQDDGQGIPPEMDMQQTDTLGLQIVCNLVEQLDGVLEIERSNGTVVHIWVPIREEGGLL